MQADIKEREFLMKTDYDIKNYEDLKKIIKRISDIEEELFKKRKSTFHDILNISKTDLDSEALRNMNYEFSNQMKANEDERNKYIIKLKAQYIPTLTQSLSQSKLEKKNIELNTYNKTEKDRQVKEAEIARIQNNNLKESQLRQDIDKKNQEIKEKESTIDKALIHYEVKRITNYKYIILHLIHSKLKYHTKSVENLTDLYKKIKEMEPDLNQFCNKYNLKDVHLKDNDKQKIKIKSSTITDNKKLKENKIKETSTNPAKGKGMIQQSIKSNYYDDLEDF